MWRLKVATGENPWLFSLSDHPGRQIWEFETNGGTEAERREVERLRESFIANRKEQKHSSDAIMRLQYSKNFKKLAGVPPVSPPPGLPSDPLPATAVTTSLKHALNFYSSIQAEDGHWAGDYGGPLFLMPGLLITLHITGTVNVALTPQHQHEMVRYMFNHQNDDGGWGLHIEGHSTMFGSVLNYVALRILGQPADHPAIIRGREWILSHGTALAITSWGKFWLSVLGVFDWRGNNPLNPEMWLLPYALPVHPGRMWCHCRQVYLPMCYLYGTRAVGPTNSQLVQDLRVELYDMPYDQIKWHKIRNLCAKEDLYYPHPYIQDRLWDLLYYVGEPVLNSFAGRWLRKRGLREVMANVHYEDENTRYICIGPVNKVINMLCCWFEDPYGESFKRHLPRIHDYLWLAEDGLKMQGYNGSQLWDTAFAVQALNATKMLNESQGMLRAAHSYVDKCQVLEDCPPPLSRWYRHRSLGAWPFSSRDHGWPISDCTAEGLKAALILESLPSSQVGEPLTLRRLCDAVDTTISFQNKGGGCATYELTRSYPWLEVLNPAETFGDIVIDYQYVECTSACITALSAFAAAHPEYRAEDIKQFIRRGREYIVNVQRDDGSWYGSWGVCFTYGTWFGVTGLIAAGSSFETSLSLRKAVQFLLDHELPGGGWGESYRSSQDKVYTNLPGNRPHIVNTSWAMLTLMAAGQAQRDPRPLHAAARVLLQAQMANGDFPQEEIIGVFNGNCMISYSAYRNIFPIWALGEYMHKVAQVPSVSQ